MGASALGDGYRDLDGDDSLIQGKLLPPAPRADIASRSELIDRLRTGGSRVVAVTAPAGYGKSTLLAEWAAAENRPVAWAAVDRFDDDPASLLSLLAAAAGPIVPRVARVTAEMRGVGPSMLGRSAPMLASALAMTEEPFVLFLDDIHLTGSPECRDVLEVVLAAIPTGSQVVLASRNLPDYLARLHVGGSVSEVGPEDLRMDLHGARLIYRTANSDASDEELARSLERCEGWPAGLFLSALIGDTDQTSTPALRGDDKLLSDYLYRECLAQLTPELQAFLRETSLLDDLSPALCDAVRETSDSQAMLRELEVLNLFLIPLDRRRRWFRYHALFREFLLNELERRDSSIVPVLHMRAASWLEQAGRTGPAIEHLLAAGDRDRSPSLVAEFALPTYQRGEVSTIERWLDELGDAVIESHPPVAVIAAWTAILQGKSPASERWAAVLERIRLADAPREDQISFDSARAMVRAAMGVGGAEQVLRDARFSVEHEPAWSPWRDQALHLHGAALLLAGDTVGARRAFEDASLCAVQMGNADSEILSEAELAMLDVAQGEWETAAIHAAAAQRAIDLNHMEGYATTGLAMAVSARIARHAGERDAAHRLLARGMRARVQCTHVMPYLAMKVRLQLANCYFELGDRGAAMHLVHEIDELLSRFPDVGALKEEIHTFRGRIEASGPGTVATVPLSPAEMRILPYLQTHLTIREIGQRLFISHNTARTEIASIYRKLGVGSRSGAVEQALQLGLLGE